MKKGIAVGIIALFMIVSVVPSTGTLFAKYSIQLELIIEGPTLGVIGEVLNYTLLINNSGEDTIWYKISWGDGDESDWMGPYSSGDSCHVSHSWSECGTYTIRAGVKCDNGTYWAELEVKIFDPLPKLILDGPLKGKAGEPYPLTIILIDPEECQFYLNINWGDGSGTGWIGPFLSNTNITARHSWDKEGHYVIEAAAKDAFDNTYYATLEVTMPKNQNMQLCGFGGFHCCRDYYHSHFLTDYCYNNPADI